MSLIAVQLVSSVGMFSTYCDYLIGRFTVRKLVAMIFLRETVEKLEDWKQRRSREDVQSI